LTQKKPITFNCVYTTHIITSTITPFYCTFKSFFTAATIQFNNIWRL